jgi:DTW domain-containing protein YfiP
MRISPTAAATGLWTRSSCGGTSAPSPRAGGRRAPPAPRTSAGRWATPALCVGTSFDDHPLVRPLLDGDATYLLFPGAGALTPDALPVPPRALIVLDGTWPQARKLLTASPRIAALPRVSRLAPIGEGSRIRRPPAPECLPTVEAVAAALGTFEGDRPAYAHMVDALGWMVSRQLAFAAGEV